MFHNYLIYENSKFGTISILQLYNLNFTFKNIILIILIMNMSKLNRVKLKNG